VAPAEYELVALHLGTFRGDKNLLRTFLDGYGHITVAPGRMLAWTLIHHWEVLAEIMPHDLDPARITDLDELADLLWNLDSPGLS
jgi:hypothetical protein